MTMAELQTGAIFAIENIPSYPKLKIEGGYVDMRDEIVNKSGNCDNKEVRELSVEDIAKSLKWEDRVELNEWINNLKAVYIKS
jgi:hypothetical protein